MAFSCFCKVQVYMAYLFAMAYMPPHKLYRLQYVAVRPGSFAVFKYYNAVILFHALLFEYIPMY